MHDADIRAVLRADVLAQHAGDSTTRVVDELGLRQGTVRVDLAVVNGVIHGYEIKSLADTLRRLPGQVEVYSAVLDFSTIVLAEAHRGEAMKLIPEWWGVVVASCTDARITIDTYRSAQPNPSVNMRALAELLWHQEALALLARKSADKGVRTKPRAYAWDRVCEVCTFAELSHEVRERIKGRRLQPAGQRLR